MTDTLHLSIDFGDQSKKVGQLYASREMGRHVFSYDADFIASRIEISPLVMPLAAKTYAAQNDPDLYNLHGVFADCLPDDWGRRVQDAEFEKIGILQPTALQRLAFVGQAGIGALRFEPAQDFAKGEDIVSIAQLRKATQQIINGDVEEVSDALLKSGGSAGGARPKYLLDMKADNHSVFRYTQGIAAKEYVPILLKVPTSESDQYQRIEYAYCRMAQDAGLRIPNTYLINGASKGQAHFAIERFDIQPGGLRLHAHTLAGITGTNFRQHRISADEFLRTIDDVTRNQAEISEGFRRVVFNYLSNNKDDHSKNFGFVMDKTGRWSLSPAYDIAFSKGQNDQHFMRLNNKFNNAEAHDFKRLAEDFGVDKWQDNVGRMLQACTKFEDYAKDAGVNDKYTYMVSSRIKENCRRIGRNM